MARAERRLLPAEPVSSLLPAVSVFPRDTGGAGLLAWAVGRERLGAGGVAWAWLALALVGCAVATPQPSGAQPSETSSQRVTPRAAAPQANVAAEQRLASVALATPEKEAYCRWRGVEASQVQAANAALVLTPAARAHAIATQLPWGVPTPKPLQGQQQLRALREFVLLYDAHLRAPLWTAYRLGPLDVLPAKRLEAFRTDPLIDVAAQASCKDYVEPIFDMGHLVPRADMNRSVDAMLNSFLLSNMTPQHCATNRGPWQVLEGLVRDWASSGTLLIYSGVLHDWQPPAGQDPDETIPRMYSERLDERRVAVPSHLYKIIVRIDPEEAPGPAGPLPHAVLAWLIPNAPQVVPSADMEGYLTRALVSVEQLQQLTRRRFFPKLMRASPATANRMLRARPTSLWPVQGEWPRPLTARCNSDAAAY